MRPRVVVVGAGAAGASCAMHAAELGAESVVVIDQAYPAEGSSGLSAGIFNRQTPDLVELELRAWSVDYLGMLERENGFPLVRCGYVRAAASSDQLATFEEAIESQRAFGITDSRVIDDEQLRSLVPGISTHDLVGGLYCPSDGTFDGHLLCSTYLERGNVELKPRTRLVGASFTSRGVLLETTRGELECDVVVNAAGAWAPRVAELLDCELPLVAQRHETCIVHLDGSMDPLWPAVNEYVPGSPNQALYFRPEGPRRLIAGLHSHRALAPKGSEDPDAYSRSPSYDYLEQVAEKLNERLPQSDDLRLESGWTGLYPISPDGRFIVGRHPHHPEVVSAAGLGGVGLTVSPAVGRIAAEWAVLGRSDTFSCATELLPERASLKPAPAGTA